MSDNTTAFDAVAFTEYLVKATVDCWTAFSFPALYFARYL